MTKFLRLGVNIDHVATIRNARGGRHPDPARAATEVAQARQKAETGGETAGAAAGAGRAVAFRLALSGA